jgi:hypothetical protein
MQPRRCPLCTGTLLHADVSAYPRNYLGIAILSLPIHHGPLEGVVDDAGQAHLAVPGADDAGVAGLADDADHALDDVLMHMRKGDLAAAAIGVFFGLILARLLVRN